MRGIQLLILIIVQICLSKYSLRNTSRKSATSMKKSKFNLANTKMAATIRAMMKNKSKKFSTERMKKKRE